MIRKGLIPTFLGLAVTSTGALLRGIDMNERGMRKDEMMSMVAAGMIGFGLAHVILGTKSLMND